MLIRTFVAVASITVLPLDPAWPSDTVIAGNMSCAKPLGENDNAVTHFLVSSGWIMGWLSAANRMGKVDWLVNVKTEHIIDVISKYCSGNTTVEEAGLSALAQLRMEAAARIEYKRQTGKEAPQE